MDGQTMMTDGKPLHGMMVYNVPMGSRGFVEGGLDQRMKTIQ